MLLNRATPELGTFDDVGAFVKGKCSYAVRAQRKAKTGKVRCALCGSFCVQPPIPRSAPLYPPLHQENIGAGPGHGETGILEANEWNAENMRQAAADPTKDLGPWTLRMYKDRSTGSEPSDVAFEYSGDSFRWTDMAGLLTGSFAGKGKVNFKYECHGVPLEGSLPYAFLEHRKQHEVFHNDFEHAGKSVYDLLRGLAGLDRKRHGNVAARLPCGQAFEIFFGSDLPIGRREDCSSFLEG